MNPSAEGSQPTITYLNHEMTVRSWLLTHDHKPIGVMFLVGVLLALLLGGTFAMALRIDPARVRLPAHRHLPALVAALRPGEPAQPVGLARVRVVQRLAARAAQLHASPALRARGPRLHPPLLFANLFVGYGVYRYYFPLL